MNLMPPPTPNHELFALGMLTAFALTLAIHIFVLMIEAPYTNQQDDDE